MPATVRPKSLTTPEKYWLKVPSIASPEVVENEREASAATAAARVLSPAAPLDAFRVTGVRPVAKLIVEAAEPTVKVKKLAPTVLVGL